jgi:formiminoglutamate deiminase
VEVAGGPPPADAEQLRGLVLPGLVNAHSHAFHRALRSRTQAGRGTFWTWRDQMYRLAATLTPESYGHLAAATFAEMAEAGITAVGEFHYLHHAPGGRPYEDANEFGEALRAAADEAGVRLTLLDTCYLHGGIGAKPNEVQRRFADASAEAWVERVSALKNGPTVRVGTAVHSVRAVAPEEMVVVGRWAADHRRVLHAHVSEQPAENDDCVAAYGTTPVEVLGRAGLLGERFTAVHATHLADGDVAALGGSHVCFCPTTERDLADGIGPAAGLTGAGAALCLGSDSHAVIDLFEEARAVELDARLATGERGHLPAVALLTAATDGGARSLGWPEAGRLEAGALADLAVVDLGGATMAGAAPGHLVEAAVFAATAADVRDVMVGGRWVVRDGEHVRLRVGDRLAAVIAEAWEEASV